MYMELQSPEFVCATDFVKAKSYGQTDLDEERERSVESSEKEIGESDAHQPNPLRKKFKHPSSKRQQLSGKEAVEIFQMRPRSGKDKPLRRGSKLLCKTIAPEYGVSAKTIRDIWSGRTWLNATEHLWTEEEKIYRKPSMHTESRESSKTYQQPHRASPPTPTYIPRVPGTLPLFQTPSYDHACSGRWPGCFGGLPLHSLGLPSSLPASSIGAATSWLGSRSCAAGLPVGLTHGGGGGFPAPTWPLATPMRSCAGPPAALDAAFLRFLAGGAGFFAGTPFAGAG